MFTSEELVSNRSKIPCRDDILTEDISRDVEAGKRLMFVPATINERNIYTGGRLIYHLFLFGALSDGSKCTIVINDIVPYVDIGIYRDYNNYRDQRPLSVVMESLLETLHNNDIVYKSTEVIYGTPGTGFCINKIPYIRVYFYTTNDRTKAINLLNVKKGGNFTTFNDDSKVYSVYFRRYDKTLCNWLTIDNYTVESALARHGMATTSKYANTKYVLVVGFTDVDKYRGEITPALRKDPLLVGTFDCETDYGTTNPTPTVIPSPENPKDSIFMLGMTFHWHWDKTPCMRIILTTVACPPISGTTVIYCRRQSDLIKMFFTILRYMQPDIMLDFNGSNYDWKFLKYRDDTFHKSITCFTNAKDNKYICAKYRHRKVKLSAQTTLDNNEYFISAGMITVDMCVYLRKIYKDPKLYSLNYFLSINKLDSKEYMPYKVMFRVHRLMEYCMTKYGRDYNTIENAISKLPDNQPAIIEDSWINRYPDLGDALYGSSCLKTYQSGGNIFAKPPSENVKEPLMNWEFKALVKYIGAVAEYCIIDAQRCHELMWRKNIIIDVRSIVEITYTDLEAGFYYADGSKIRNRIYADANRAAENYMFTSISVYGADKKKKNIGAYIIPPTKGCYRDDKLIKRKRILLKREGAKSTSFPFSDVDPRSPTFDKRLLDDTLFTDDDDQSDLPVTGIDAQSMYPSIILTRNYCHTTYVATKEEADALSREGFKLIEVNFEVAGVSYTGWFIQPIVTARARLPDEKFSTGDDIENNIVYEYKYMGLIPRILKSIFDQRVEVKKEFSYYKSMLEIVDTDAAKKLDTETALLEYLDSIPKGKDAAAFIRKVGYKEYYDELTFNVNSLNAKQLSLKLLMNTVYGETNNKDSPIYLIHMGCGVTTYGQYTIKTVKEYLSNEGCRVVYGDTDSVYISIPYANYSELENRYFRGEISRREYWEGLVKTTMADLKVYIKQINNLMIEINGNRMLRFAYEEVLFPAFFAGKKKYFGVPHEHELMFWLCEDNCDSEKFKDKIFIRGLEYKKSGASKLLEIISVQTMMKLMNMKQTATIENMILQELDAISTGMWPNEIFIKNYQYRPHKKNVTLLTFIDRMKELGQHVPESGDRIQCIISKKYPWVDNIKGKAIKIKLGDRLEYYSAIGDVTYETKIGEPVEVDLEYYVVKEISGSLARLLISTGKFGPTNNKEEEKVAMANARKYLSTYYKNNYSRPTVNVGGIKKTIYRKYNTQLMRKYREEYGDKSSVIRKINKYIGDSVASQATTKIFNELDKYCKEKAEIGQDNVNYIVDKYITKYGSIYAASAKITTYTMNRLGRIRKMIITTKERLRKLIPKLYNVCYEKIKVLDSKVLQASTKYKINRNKATSEEVNFLIERIKEEKMGEEFRDIQFSKEDRLTVEEVYNIINDLGKYYTSEAYAVCTCKRISYLKDKKAGYIDYEKADKNIMKAALESYINKLGS